MKPLAHHFAPHDFVGGHAVLDLANTVTARDDAVPADWLADYASLLQWAEASGVAGAAEIATLGRQARSRPAAARAALQRLRALREALHAVLHALQAGRRIPPPALLALEQARQAALKRSALRVEGSSGADPSAVRVRARPTLEAAGLEFIADTLLLQALPLLEDPPLPRLKRCDGSHCGWLFIDQSKAGRRRWCDMATCGAAHKAQRTREKLSKEKR